MKFSSFVVIEVSSIVMLSS
jgi:hypothetical protein